MYQWSNFIYNCMSTFLHYVRCKDALLDCSAPGGEWRESLTRVDEISLFGNSNLVTESVWHIITKMARFHILYSKGTDVFDPNTNFIDISGSKLIFLSQLTHSDD